MASRIARDIMTTEIIKVRTHTPVRELAKIMWEKKLRCLPVFDEDERLVGVVTEEDLVHQDARVHFPTFFHFLDSYIMLGSTKKYEEELKRAVGSKAEDLMEIKFPRVRPESDITEIASKMVEKDWEYVMVMDEEKLEGIITRNDIIRHLASEGESR